MKFFVNSKMPKFISLGCMSLTIMVASLTILPAQSAYAQNFGEICKGADIAGVKCDAPGDPKAPSELSENIRQVIQIFSAIVGLVAVMMILFSGFKYITAGGDSSKISTAQQTLIYAIVGLAIAGTAQIIAQFVLYRTVTPAPKGPSGYHRVIDRDAA